MTATTQNSQLINTQCSPIALAFDATLTAAGWAGFFYLFGTGILTIVNEGQASPHAPVLTQFLPIMQTLSVYLLIGALNALLLVLWSRYQKTTVKTAPNHAAVPHQILDEQTLASSFHLSCTQLHHIHDSRITVIHHTENGDIVRLETNDLNPQNVYNDEEFRTLRVA